MIVTLRELREIVGVAIFEAKKKKSKKKSKKKDEQTVEDLGGYKLDKKLDYSPPMGDLNVYKRQGASNLGPYTSENALRLCVRDIIRESFHG